jgi:UDP-N-acetylglucosamine acyltransferase
MKEEVFIHSTAIVEDGAKLGKGVYVGPFCYVGKDVEIGDGTRLIANVSFFGWVKVGKNNVFYPGAVIGAEPQDIAYKGDRSYVVIGDNNIFREHTTVHRGTKAETTTKIGSNCFFMVGSHIAHNCVVGDGVILVNNALLAGYVEVGDKAFISGNTAIHQFVRVGKLSLVSGGTVISKDLPPFCITEGRNNPPRALNVVGLKRNGIVGERLSVLKQLFKIFFRSSLSLEEALDKIKRELPFTDEVKEFIEFIEKNKRGILRAKG